MDLPIPKGINTDQNAYQVFQKLQQEKLYGHDEQEPVPIFVSSVESGNSDKNGSKHHLGKGVDFESHVIQPHTDTTEPVSVFVCDVDSSSTVSDNDKNIQVQKKVGFETASLHMCQTSHMRMAPPLGSSSFYHSKSRTSIHPKKDNLGGRVAQLLSVSPLVAPPSVHSDIEKKWRRAGTKLSAVQTLTGKWGFSITKDDTSQQDVRKIMRDQKSLLKMEKSEVPDGAPKFQPLQTFRRVARIVHMLCKVCIAMRKYAIDAGFLDNYSVNVTRKTKVGEGEDSTTEEIKFNIKDFQLRKELAVPQNIKLLFNKHPSERTPKDILTIGRLMRSLPSFRKYTREMQDLFSKIVRYMRCGRRRVVLRKGHIGYNLYFIYTGAVSVVLDKDDGNVFVKKEVVMLRKGACFGEVSLVEDTRRTATIVTAEDTEFLYIDKDDFIENNLDARMQEEFKFRYSFFRNWQPLTSWDEEKVKDLSFNGRMEEYSYNKVVIKDSRKNKWLWFVIKGSCDVLRLVDLEKCPTYQRTVLTGRHMAEPNTILQGSSSSRLDRVKSAQPRLQSKNSLCMTDNENASDISVTGMSKAISPKRPKTSTGNRSSNKKESSLSLVSEICSDTTITSDIGKDLGLNNSSSGDSIGINLDNKNIGSGLFMKVDTVRDGKCFGLDFVFEEGGKTTSAEYSLVSKGCEVIQVPLPKFMELADKETLKQIKALVIEYPTDDELCKTFLKKTKWECFKKELIASVVVNHANNPKYGTSLRNNRYSGYVQNGGCVDTESESANESFSCFSTTSHNIVGEDVPEKKIPTGDSKTVPRARPQLRSVSVTGYAPSSQRCNSSTKISEKGGYASTGRDKSSHIKTSSVLTGTPVAPPKVARPRTCPARVRRRVMSPVKSTQVDTPDGIGGSFPTTTYLTKNGYQVRASQLYAKSSKRTLQLIQTVRSPNHERRLKMIHTK